MDFLNDLGKRLSSAARSVQEKTRDGVELTRIANDLRTANAELDRLYGALGRTYFDAQAAGDPDTAIMAPFVEKINAALTMIASLNSQRDKLRQQLRCPACGSVQPVEARFCSACGARMPEPAVEEASSVRTVTCPACGAACKEDAAFCTDCGHRFGEEPVASEPEITWPGEKPDTVSTDEEPQEGSQE